MGKTSVNRYKGSTLTRVPTLLLAVTKDLAFFAWLLIGRLPGFVFGRSPEWSKATSFLGGVWGHAPPGNFFEMNMRCDAIWCILRLNFEKWYSVCTDLVASG